MFIIPLLSQWELARSAEAYQTGFQVDAAMTPRAPAIAMHIIEGNAEKDPKRMVAGDERKENQAFFRGADKVGMNCMVMPCEYGRVAPMQILFEINELDSGENRGSASSIANSGRQVAAGIVDNLDKSPAHSTLSLDRKETHVDRPPRIRSGKDRHNNANHTDDTQYCDEDPTDPGPLRSIEGDPVIFGCDFITYDALPSRKTRDAQVQKSDTQVRVLFISLLTAFVAALCITSRNRILAVFGFAAINFALLCILVVLADVLGWWA